MGAAAGQAATDSAPRDADAAAALFERAEVQRRAGNPEGEFELLAQVLEADASHAAAHQRLAELTGPAPLDPQ